MRKQVKDVGGKDGMVDLVRKENDLNRDHRIDAVKNVLVVGATGGSGRATVSALLQAGHKVTAFARSADSVSHASDRLRTVNGDATDPAAVHAVMPGHDAVVVTLGITENALLVRLFGASRTPLDIRSRGTRVVVAAMKAHAVRRLVVMSSYGVGATRDRLVFMERVFFSLILKPQIADTEIQEQLVRDSGLDWTIAQPVHLTDAVHTNSPFESVDGEVRKRSVSRGQVAQFLSNAAVDIGHWGCAVALSSV